MNERKGLQGGSEPCYDVCFGGCDTKKKEMWLRNSSGCSGWSQNQRGTAGAVWIYAEEGSCIY